MKKIDYKIASNNIDKFIRLGNIIPSISSIERFTSKFNTNLNNLLMEISSDNITNLFIQYRSKSKIKTLSTVVLDLIDELGISKHMLEDYYTPNERVYTILTEIISSRYYNKWLKIWETFSIEYNPIKPYDMTINETRAEQHGGSTEISRDSTRKTDSETVNKITDDTTDNSIYGFNSVNPVPSDKSVNNSEENYTDDTTITDNSELSTKHGRKVDEDKDISRVGNIGNITQQELIEREREIHKYQIWDTIFKDLDSVLTRSKYII